jgi:nitroreductase
MLVALTGIPWREAWKYGLRAFRYCQHDCGHALTALAYAAAIFSWSARQLAWGDAQIGALTGVDRHDDFHAGEPENPEALVWIGPGQAPNAAGVLAALAGAHWCGTANRLSAQQRDWPDIPAVTAATIRPAGAIDDTVAEVDQARLAALSPGTSSPASALIRRRRSAQAFDGVTTMTARHFQRLLDALLLRPDVPPWSLAGHTPEVHPVFFVHRVEGLMPGIYALPRTSAAQVELRAAMGGDWLWERVATMPEHLPFYLLAPLDVLGFAATASCHQDIAADSAFMVAMLARFDDLAGGDTAHGWRYRRRFHEAGMLGQVFYLEAEAGGLQGTGIGCYFDDVVHRALQLDTTRFQDVYHFTVGKALVDQRLGNETGYAFLGERVRPSDD